MHGKPTVPHQGLACMNSSRKTQTNKTTAGSISLGPSRKAKGREPPRVTSHLPPTLPIKRILNLTEIRGECLLS